MHGCSQRLSACKRVGVLVFTRVCVCVFAAGMEQTVGNEPEGLQRRNKLTYKRLTQCSVQILLCFLSPLSLPGGKKLNSLHVAFDFTQVFTS